MAARSTFMISLRSIYRLIIEKTWLVSRTIPDSDRTVAFLDFVVREERLRARVMNDDALIEHISAIGDVERQFHVLLHQQDRRPLLLHAAQQFEHFVDQNRHDPFGWLVE